MNESTRRKLVYLATPYTHDDMEVRQERFEVVTKMAGEFFKRGTFVFSPISHCHPVKILCDMIGTDWHTWQEYDEYMISLCDELYVMMVPGWQASIGVTAEIEFATKIGKPVKFITLLGDVLNAPMV